MTDLILLRDWQASQIEFWRKIEGWPAYDVSNWGRVRSYWTFYNSERRGQCRWKIGPTPKVIGQHYDKRGYARVVLSDKMRYKRGLTRTIHRLVAEAFLPNPDNLPQVNHKNACRADNRLWNLEHVSRSQNMRHAFDSGLFDRIIKHGTLNNLSTISDDEVRIIHKLSALGASVPLIAKAMRISERQVGRFVKGEARPHLRRGKNNGGLSRFTRRSAIA